MMKISNKLFFIFIFFCQLICFSQVNTLYQINKAIEKKAEFHKITGGEQEGYRIKIYFGSEKDEATKVRLKFNSIFEDITTYEDYQPPNHVVLVGDFRTKLEAVEVLKKIQSQFQSSFIVKDNVVIKLPKE